MEVTQVAMVVTIQYMEDWTVGIPGITNLMPAGATAPVEPFASARHSFTTVTLLERICYTASVVACLNVSFLCWTELLQMVRTGFESQLDVRV
uniref:Uncharacterized protein n=1 Tax=Timema tahoe TaxID=61484 RepID=A0A7R9FKV9_9NEOP|nr:unnamed protein product [Timema tahoe]